MAVASAPEYGGYDYKFSGRVPERFMCNNICTKVLREPHLTVCCGQHFCDSCLKNWFKKQGKKSCPHCREDKDFNHFLNKALKREIDELKIHCTHHKDGCQWIGELGNLQTHLDSESGCGYVEVECTNKCRVAHEVRKFQRKGLQDHLANECTRRRYKCEYCGHEAMYKDITGKGYRRTHYSHYNTCYKYPLDCPNKCGEKPIQRKDMYAHRNKCLKEPVKCPFKVEGCKTRVVRKDFDNHMSTQMLQHLLLMKTKHDMDMQEMKTKHDKDMKKRESELTRTMRGISMNVDSLLQTCTEDQKLPLQSIRAIIDKSHHLDNEYDSLTIEIPDLSQYKRSRKVWRSPPFYFREGYKMCLAVYPNGIGKGEGTHVSLYLGLMKGEFDDELEWPIRCDSEYYYEELEVKVMPKQPQQKANGSTWFRVAGLNRVHDDQVVQSSESRFPCSDTFLKHGTRDEQKMVRGALAKVRMHITCMEDEPYSSDDDD